MHSVYLYHSRTNYEAADAFVAELRARDDVGVVSPGRSDRWEGEVLGDHVFHDGSNRALVWAHEQAGIPVELFTESATQVEREPEPITVQEPEPEPDYHVTQSGSWYSVIGPDGEKVGRSYRDEADAYDALDEALADA